MVDTFIKTESTNLWSTTIKPIKKNKGDLREGKDYFHVTIDDDNG